MPKPFGTKTHNIPRLPKHRDASDVYTSCTVSCKAVLCSRLSGAHDGRTAHSARTEARAILGSDPALMRHPAASQRPARSP
eukprot:4542380-Prymnesium_polylepis.1